MRKNFFIGAICCTLMVSSVEAQQQLPGQPLSFQPTGVAYDRNAVESSLEGVDDSLEPWNDDRERPKVSTVGFSKHFAGLGAVSVHGSGHGGAPRLGLGHNYYGQGWLKGIESRVESDEFQTVFSAGGTAALLDNGTGLVAARALGGYAMRHHDVNEDSFQYTIDLYGARPIKNGRHWLKAGWFVDQQEEFGKHGPELGLLAFANCPNPLTVDMAYGFGWGNSELVGDELVQAADDDVQLRIGTILKNRFHVGGTLQYLQYESFGVEDTNEVWEGGAFVGFSLPCGRIQLDGTTGELGTSGMLSFVWIPGGGNIFRQVPVACGGCACRPEGWLATPVARRTQVRVRRHGDAGVGPLFGLNVSNVRLRLNVDAGVAGLNIGDADEAEIEIELENEGGLFRDLDVLGFLLFDGLNSGNNSGPISIPPGGGRAIINTDPNVGPGPVTQLIYETTFRDENGQTRILRAVFAPGSTNGATATSINVL